MVRPIKEFAVVVESKYIYSRISPVSSRPGLELEIIYYDTYASGWKSFNGSCDIPLPYPSYSESSDHQTSPVRKI